MVELLSEETGPEVYKKYARQLSAEYRFWMNGASKVSEEVSTYDRVVLMPGRELLNRYWDNLSELRPEGFFEDVMAYTEVPVAEQANFYRNIRAACESGWDFSGRWFRADNNFSSIYTTELIPVDLNCLLWHLEHTLAKCHELSNDLPTANIYQQKAIVRATAIQSTCGMKQKAVTTITISGAINLPGMLQWL